MKLNEVIAKYGNQEVDESKIKEVLGVKESKVYRPIIGSWFYYVSENGLIGNTKFDGLKEQVYRYDTGNFYLTLEESQFARDKQTFLTKFERYLRENEDEPVDWLNDNQKKYNIIFDLANLIILIDNHYRYLNQGTVVTTSRQVLEQFIKNNESDIKKYMFGVK